MPCLLASAQGGEGRSEGLAYSLCFYALISSFILQGTVLYCFCGHTFRWRLVTAFVSSFIVTFYSVSVLPAFYHGF